MRYVQPVKGNVRMDQVITCSAKGTEPSVELVATFPTMVFASVSRIMLHKYIKHKLFQYMLNKRWLAGGLLLTST